VGKISPSGDQNPNLSLDMIPGVETDKHHRQTPVDDRLQNSGALLEEDDEIALKIFAPTIIQKDGMNLLEGHGHMLGTPQGGNVDFPHVTGLSSSKQGMGTSYNNNASSWSAKNGKDGS